MEVIRMDNVSLWRRTQEEFSYDFKTSVLSFLKGTYRHPKRKLVLEDVNLSIETGARIGIIGSNGSGKSTLLKLVSNVLMPTCGTVRVSGSIAPLLELGAGFDPEMNVADNVVMYGILLGRSRKEIYRRIPYILEFAELEDEALIPFKALSSGMRARLGFAVATDTIPNILLLDEILGVGDARFQEKCRKRIERFWEAEATILAVSHNLNFIRKWCERAVWIDRGRVAFVGDVEDGIAKYTDFIKNSN